jgi:hypothetical protein
MPKVIVLSDYKKKKNGLISISDKEAIEIYASLGMIFNPKRSAMFAISAHK